MSDTRAGLQALTTVPTISADEWRQTATPVRWLIATRASVLLMTLMSAALGGLLAMRDGGGDPGLWLLCALGLALAHATNNLLNDYTDSRRGVDSGNYYRNQYGVHVLEDGLMSLRQFYAYVAITGGLALLVGAAIVSVRGGLTLPLMTAGAFFVLFYTWPLKYIGLGEPAVLLVWGPLMVGGTYYVTTGQWSAEAAWLGTLYGLGPTAVLFGKHIDKIDLDREKGVHTLPVLLGSQAARQGAKMLLITQYAGCLALVLTEREHWILLAVLIASPALYRCLKVFSEEKPAEKPERFPGNIWPLWFAPHAFSHTRRFTPVFLVALLIAQWLPA